MSKYRWGIDLGTASIGVAVYEIDDNGEILSLQHLDSYIFREPVDSTQTGLFTSNTERRRARLMRRQIERKAARLRKIAHIAKTLGVTAEILHHQTDDVIALRAQALTQTVTLPQFVKVMCHIVKNRGYRGVLKGGRKVGAKLDKTKEMLGDDKTLGQVLLEHRAAAAGQPWRKLEEDGTFIYREEVEQEFEKIWETQEKFHPELKQQYPVGLKNMFPDYPGQKEISLKQAFKSALFYQRPIRWELDTIGDCLVYPNEKRAACAQIAYQEYRIAKNIVNLRFKNPQNKDGDPLTLQQCTDLFNYFDAHTEEYDSETGKLPYNKIYKILGVEGKRFTVHRDSDLTDGIKGNLTLKEFADFGKLNEWAALTPKAQEVVVEFLANITSYTDIEDNTDEYIEQKVAELTKNTHAEPTERKSGLEFILSLKKDRFFSSNAGDESDGKAKKSKKSFRLESGRASFSVRALQEITARLLKGEQEDAILNDLCPIENQLAGKLRTVAAIQKAEGLKDPVILKALNEFDRVAQYLLHKNWKPSEIIIELSREMKKSLSLRNFLENQNKKRQKERAEAIKEIKNLHKPCTETNIERYLLWIEQEKKSPYSGAPIQVEDALNNKITQVDHIIPRQGEIGGPNTFSNKVLVFAHENKDKSNQLPYQWKFKEDIDAYRAWLNARKPTKGKKKKEEVEPFGFHSPLINFVQHLWTLYVPEKNGYRSSKNQKGRPTPRGRAILDKINNLLATPDDLQADFVARQNQETAWIGKIVLRWCEDICPNVYPGFGTLTAYLRRKLQFDRILLKVRLKEGRPLYDKDGHVLDSEKWKELIKEQYDQLNVAKADFEAYCAQLEPPCFTEKDKKKAFDWFYEEESKKFYKRCDHRHHAVDAAVIGLCSVSVVQRAEKFYRKRNTLDKVKCYDSNGNYQGTIDGFMLSAQEIKTAVKLREQVENYLTDYVVWHKPDHNPSGAFFKQNAYRVDEKTNCLISRADLSDFLRQSNKLLTQEQLIKSLDSLLWGEDIKKAVITQLKERLKQGLTTEEALCGRKLPNTKGQYDPADGIKYHGNKVKKVKYIYKTKDPIKFRDNLDISLEYKDKMGNCHKKAYQNAGFACMDFEKNTGKRKAAVAYWKYNKTVPEGVIRVFANDILFNKKDKQFYIVKSFKQECLVLWPVTETVAQEKKPGKIQDYCLVRTREDIKRLREEYGK